MTNTHGINNTLAGVPYDGEPVQETVKIHPLLTTSMVVLAAAGATFAIVCIVFNFVNRKKRLDLVIDYVSMTVLSHLDYGRTLEVGGIHLPKYCLNPGVHNMLLF